MDVTKVGMALLVLALTACSGARHRKPVGPPPEYELPEEPDAGFARDAGLR